MHLLNKYQPDKQIENYVFSLNACIGKGSSGTVYVGKHQVSEEVVAIKAIDMRSLKTEYAWKMLCSEVKIMKKLKHPHVVRLLDVFQTKNNTYIITEFCNQGDLRTFLKQRKSLTEKEAVAVASQIASGLHELAAHGIIHRDLKPANILVNDNIFKITDFGFAKKLDSMDDQLMDSLVGTPLYMAPQILHKQQYTSKCDSWSVGLILYELMYGRTPWPAVNVVDLVHKMSSIPLAFPKEYPISSQMQAFLLRCLCFSENDRISIQEMCTHSLFEGYVQLVLQKLLSSEDGPFISAEQDFAASQPSIQQQFQSQKKGIICNFESTTPQNSQNNPHLRNKSLSHQTNQNQEHSSITPTADETARTPQKSSSTQISHSSIKQRNVSPGSVSPSRPPQQRPNQMDAVGTPNHKPPLQDFTKKLEYQTNQSYIQQIPSYSNISPIRGNNLQAASSPFHKKSNTLPENQILPLFTKSPISAILGDNVDQQKQTSKQQQPSANSQPSNTGFNFIQGQLPPSNVGQQNGSSSQLNIININNSNSNPQTNQAEQIDPFSKFSSNKDASNNSAFTNFHQQIAHISQPKQQQHSLSPRPSKQNSTFTQAEQPSPLGMGYKTPKIQDFDNFDSETKPLQKDQDTIRSTPNKQEEQNNKGECQSFYQPVPQYSFISPNKNIFFPQQQNNRDSPDSRKIKNNSFSNSNGFLSTKNGSTNGNSSSRIHQQNNSNSNSLLQQIPQQTAQQVQQLASFRNQVYKKEFESVSSQPQQNQRGYLLNGIPEQQQNVNAFQNIADYENYSNININNNSNNNNNNNDKSSFQINRDTSPQKPPIGLPKRSNETDFRQIVSPTQGRGIVNEYNSIGNPKYFLNKEQKSSEQNQNGNKGEYDYQDKHSKRTPLQNYPTNYTVNRSRSLQQQQPLVTLQKMVNKQHSNSKIVDLKNNSNCNDQHSTSEISIHSANSFDAKKQQRSTSLSKQEKQYLQQQYATENNSQTNRIPSSEANSCKTNLTFRGQNSVSPVSGTTIEATNLQFISQEQALEGLFNLISGVNKLKIQIESMIQLRLRKENPFLLDKLIFLLNRYLVIQSSFLKVVIMEKGMNFLQLERWSEFILQDKFKEMYQRVLKQHQEIIDVAQINWEKASQQNIFQLEAKRDYYFGKMFRQSHICAPSQHEDNTNFYFYVYQLLKVVIKEYYQQINFEINSLESEDNNLLSCLGKLVDFHQLLKLIISQKEDYSLIIKSHTFQDIVKEKQVNSEFYSDLKQKMCLYDLISQHSQISQQSKVAALH